MLDYFAQSPFYDPTSNNAVLRMQTQYSVEAGMGGLNEAEELKRFVGIEFAVTRADPPDMFVIEKRDRTSPTEVRPIAAYYVLHNSIYQAPDLYSVISNRLLSSLFYMQTSLSAARERKTDFTPRTGGNRYKVVKPDAPAPIAAATAESAASTVATTAGVAEGAPSGSATVKAKKSGNMDWLLARALQTTIQQQQ